MSKVKIIILRIIVFCLVFVSEVLAIIYFTDENFTSKDYIYFDSITTVNVWLDVNENGKRENDEPFMPNVCVWAGNDLEVNAFDSWQEYCSNEYFLTDSNGAWHELVAGVGCSEVWNTVNVPENYFPTTPTIANGCEVEFGLSQEKPAFEIQDGGLYLTERLREKEVIYNKNKRISDIKNGLLILLTSVFAGFVSFKTIRPVKAKAG